jgi:hypothetical protein
MYFDLCNAPSTFQIPMNNNKFPFLCNVLLIFFDDIQIYREPWESHIEHVDRSLQPLREHQVFFKHSNFVFGVSEVEYLSHIVSQNGVVVNPKKVVRIQGCPSPNTLKRLCGFLRLTNYYREIVKYSEKIVAPLNSLLKKYQCLE